MRNAAISTAGQSTYAARSPWSQASPHETRPTDRLSALGRGSLEASGPSELILASLTRPSRRVVHNQRMSNGMNSPGTHEDAACAILQDASGNMAEAQVSAILALASAVNRLADAHQTAADALSELVHRR
jgi:hypothetical protein